MALEAGVIPNLFNGVSQQPATLRSRSQAESCEDYYPTIATGLRKRPPTSYVAKLRNTTATDAFVHVINRSTTERYVVVVLNGDLEVYNLTTGVACTVSFPDGKGYLTNTLPRTGFAAVTVADVTFLANKGVTVAKAATTATGTLLGTKQQFSALPGAPATNDVWKIQGDPSNSFTAYYVKWSGSAWVECVNPGLLTDLDATTMPFKLVRTALNTFTFQKNTWDSRLVGDDSINPFPSFVGQTLQDVFFFRNRFGMLSDENVILSRNGSYFNFFAETMTAVLDTDPIDVTVDAAASPDRINVLRYAVPFNKVLLLFSDQTQFQLTGGVNSLTPQTAKTDVVTSFEAAPNARPALAGSSLFFATSRGNYSGMREYYVQQDTVANDAADVSAHVPSYVPAGLFRLAASSNEDVLFALSDVERYRVYVYKHYWGDDNKKLQSAWLRFNFSSDSVVLGCALINQLCYFVVQRADGVFVESMDLHPATIDSLVNYQVLLDRKVQLTGVYNSGTNLTTWTMPYQVASGVPVVIRGSAFGTATGSPVQNPSLATTTTVTAVGDYSAGPCIVGIPYASRYRFSEQFMKDSNEASITTGKLQLAFMTVGYSGTGYFRAEVTPLGRETYTYPFTGKVIGVTPLGSLQFQSGTFKFPVGTSSKGVTIDLVNDSHLPSTFQNAAWEGNFITFSRNR